MKNSKPVVIHWFRRDLRLHDNKGLYQALNSGYPVIPLFIFDDDILNALPGNDHRVAFIYQVLQDINQELEKHGRGLLVRKGKPVSVLASLCAENNVRAVYCNEDHEPYGRTRDGEVSRVLKNSGVDFHSHLDHLVMHKDAVLVSPENQQPYRVFTPYSRAWKAKLTEDHLKYYPSEDHLKNFFLPLQESFPTAKMLGFLPSEKQAPPLAIDESLIRNYHETRDFPFLEGTSRLGVHLRFGTVSIRELVRKALQWNETFLNELIWREFYAMLLWHYPHIVNQSFKPGYDRIEWRNNEDEFKSWMVGKTGYPMVDAGMRQLNETGYMHNRVRMVVASFLSKHLLIDWRWGEAYFAEKLFDYELSSNNGGWQWSAGTGSDAAPYFRIFNPAAQQKKFDPDQKYIREWIPELDTANYPAPVVDHRQARERCLKTYKKALGP